MVRCVTTKLLASRLLGAVVFTMDVLAVLDYFRVVRL